MTDRWKSPMRWYRFGLVWIVVMLVMAGMSLGTSAPADAHSGHNCTGRTSSGFSCARSGSNGSTWDERLTYTYYNGSQRTFSRINFLHGRGAVDLVQVCDSKKGDNIRHTLEIRDALGGIHRYLGPSDNISTSCFLYSRFGYLAEAYRVVTYSSGQFSHATIWCHGCVPG